MAEKRGKNHQKYIYISISVPTIAELWLTKELGLRGWRIRELTLWFDTPCPPHIPTPSLACPGILTLKRLWNGFDLADLFGFRTWSISYQFYYSTLLSRIQITPKTSTNTSLYLYSRRAVWLVLKYKCRTWQKNFCQHYYSNEKKIPQLPHSRINPAVTIYLSVVK